MWLVSIVNFSLLPSYGVQVVLRLNLLLLLLRNLAVANTVTHEVVALSRVQEVFVLDNSARVLSSQSCCLIIYDLAQVLLVREAV